MKKINQHQRLVIVALLIAAKLLSGLLVNSPISNVAGLTALATVTPAPTEQPMPTPTPTLVPGDPIPLKSLSDLTSLEASVKINVNGEMNNKISQGQLNAVLQTNSQDQSKISVTGNLLGGIVEQVGGNAVRLFSPSQVDVYKMGQDAYIVVKGLFEVCIKPKPTTEDNPLNQMSPIALMGMLTGSDVARGKLVGNETLNGVAVKHYVINGPAFLAAAQNSSNPQLKTFAQSLWSAKDADLYVDATTGYPVSFRGSYSGEFDPLKFQGDFDVQIDLTAVNTNPTIALPSSCNNPISQ